ncbi:hypothetical protein Slin15195_G096000 [Septoria linicola]|uniref:RapZ C-terminal domain-containing protein n=1 Tax=Septoria linicola TaxID=215465 RepID=A0A9Q9ELZ3_9PEZI|nr:hypothetical protein Slin14017_G059090 [Septoria linicola]USW56281.1 hypothetical protein Slin15195_G096000 [Septoria linicola]
MADVETQTVICEIWSHSHAPPLHPPASVAFDLRKVPNPPKHVRDQYDGRSKRLSEHLLHGAVFVGLLERAAKEITQAINAIFSESLNRDAPGITTSSDHVSHDNVLPDADSSGDLTAADSVSSGCTNGPTVSDSGILDRSLVPVMNSRHPRVRHEPALQPLCDENLDSKEDPLSDSGEVVSGRSSGEEPKSDQVLRISCFCERGRHRSVAFAEELGRTLNKMPGTRSFQVVVRVQHRDVEVKSRDSGRMRRGGRGKSRVLGAAIVADQAELQDL